MSYYIDDLGLEYPELEGKVKPPTNITLNPECSRSKGIIRAWNLRPNVKRQILRYTEDNSGSFDEEDVVYPSDIQWRNGSPLFTGTGSQVTLCDAHNIREYTHRTLFTMGFTVEVDLLSGFQNIISASGGHVQIVINSAGRVNALRDSQLLVCQGPEGIISANTKHRVLYTHDASQTIDGTNRNFIYVDGDLKASTSTAASYTWFDVNFGLGAKHTGADALNGTIDDVVFWDRGLSPAERVADYLRPHDIYMTK